jgi:hypothetical protein
MDEMMVEMNSEKYGHFLRLITLLSENCNDLEMRNGIIRQRTNGNFSVFEIDATPVVEDLNIAISNLKMKLPLFNTFSGQDVSIEVNSVGDAIFKDEMSSLKIIHPAMEFLQNKYLDEEERDSIFNFDDDNMIMSCEVNSTVTERIKTITKTFNVDSIQVQFDGDTASLNSSTQARDQFAKFKDGIITNMEIENAYANVIAIPFKIEHDNDIDFKMFRDGSQNVVVNKFTTALGEMDIKIFSRSPLIFEEEEDE